MLYPKCVSAEERRRDSVKNSCGSLVPILRTYDYLYATATQSPGYMTVN